MPRPVRPRRGEHAHARPAGFGLAPRRQPIGQFVARRYQRRRIAADDMRRDQRRRRLAKRAGTNFQPEPADPARLIEIDIGGDLAAAHLRDLQRAALRGYQTRGGRRRCGQSENFAIVNMLHKTEFYINTIRLASAIISRPLHQTAPGDIVA